MMRGMTDRARSIPSPIAVCGYKLCDAASMKLIFVLTGCNAISGSHCMHSFTVQWGLYKRMTPLPQLYVKCNSECDNVLCYRYYCARAPPGPYLEW